MPQPHSGLQAGRLFRWQFGAESQPFLNQFQLEPEGWRKGWLVYDHPVPGGLLGHFHRGSDLPLPVGTNIRAVLSGRVFVPSFDPHGFGNAVQLERDRYRITYGHLSKVGTGSKDTMIHGDIIGWSGSTGNSTGPHIHWEVYDKVLGAWVDPWSVV